MLARLLPAHNDVPDDELRDRRHDMRALVSARRFGVVGMLATALVTLPGWIPLGAEFFALLVVVAIVTELEVQSVWRTTTVASLDRTISAFSMIYLAFAVVVTFETVDMPWISSAAFALLSIRAGALLPARPLTFVTLATAATFAALMLAQGVGIVPHTTVAHSHAATVGTATSHLGVAVVRIMFMSGLLIPVAAAASLSVAQRLRISRRRIRAAEAKSTIAEKDATAAREQAEEFVSGAVRQTSELEEQNRNLASVNAVSFALSGSMDEDGATETALQLIARVLEVPAVQLHELRSEGLQPRHVFVTAEPETGGERLDEALMEQAMQSSEPIVAGDVAAPLQPYAIIALIAKGRRVGSLAAIGTREAGWDERALRMFELIGRELGVALENECLYRDAVDGAEAETMVSTASRVVAVGEIDRALAQLLAMLAPVLDARVSGVVNRESGESTPRVIARYGESGSPALNAAFSAALESAPALAADRTTALVLGTGGEGPLPDALQEAAVGALAIVPVAVVSSDEAMAGG